MRRSRLFSGTVAAVASAVGTPIGRAASLPRCPASEREIKCRSCIRLGFGPHPPAMLVGDALYHCKTGSVPLELIRAVESLEDPEQLAGIRHLEAHPIVLYRQPDLAVHLNWPDPDRCPFSGPGKLDGVREQVADSDFGQAWIALHGGEVLDLPVDHPTVLRRRETVNDILHQR